MQNDSNHVKNKYIDEQDSAWNKIDFQTQFLENEKKETM